MDLNTAFNFAPEDLIANQQGHLTQGQIIWLSAIFKGHVRYSSFHLALSVLVSVVALLAIYIAYIFEEIIPFIIIVIIQTSTVWAFLRAMCNPFRFPNLYTINEDSIVLLNDITYESFQPVDFSSKDIQRFFTCYLRYFIHYPWYQDSACKVEEIEKLEKQNITGFWRHKVFEKLVICDCQYKKLEASRRYKFYTYQDYLGYAYVISVDIVD